MPPSLHVPWADIPSAAFPRAHRAQWLGAAGKLTPSAPACCRRTSRCQQRRREAHSERARSLPGHIALSALLARSSFRTCRLAPCRLLVHSSHTSRIPPFHPLPCTCAGEAESDSIARVMFYRRAPCCRVRAARAARALAATGGVRRKRRRRRERGGGRREEGGAAPPLLELHGDPAPPLAVQQENFQKQYLHCRPQWLAVSSFRTQ